MRRIHPFRRRDWAHPSGPGAPGCPSGRWRWSSGRRRSAQRGHAAPTALGLCLVLLAMVGLVAAQAQAHLTGVFLYFVKDLEEPTYSSRLLLQQIDDIDARIQALEPQVAAARKEYETAAAPIAERLLFYDAYAAGALGGLWAGSEDIVDLLTYSRMMERVLEQDLQTIREVSERYAELALRKRSLTQYRELLDAVKGTVEARDDVLAEAPEGVGDEYGRQYILYQLSEDWETMREGSFLGYFEWANRELRGVEELLTRTPDGWKLSEERLNARIGGSGGPAEEAHLFLRADHIYFFGTLQAESSPRRVLTVGRMKRVGPTSIEYRIEGIYIDGFPIDPSDPDVQEDIYQNNLLYMDFASLVPEGRSLIFRQENGSIWFGLR